MDLNKQDTFVLAESFQIHKDLVGKMNEQDVSAMLTLSDETFLRFKGFIEAELGIKMPDSKKTMLQARLQKRMRRLKIKNFEDYCDYVFSPEGEKDELSNMMDVVTTNKTDFFREPGHFQYLTDVALPELVRHRAPDLYRKIMVWSAGCSTGAEAYTLAMVLNEISRQIMKFDFSILATDISTRVLDTGRAGIYREEEAEPIPEEMKRRYLLRSKDRSKELIRIVPLLRSKVEFKRLNFMDSDFGMRQSMDIVFCRNVIIYFKRQTQQAVLGRLCRHLKTGGYLFMGHSETLNGLNLPVKQVANAVYRKV